MSSSPPDPTIRGSLSARVFLGFVLVLVAFASVLGFTVVRMQGVRAQLELIDTRYLRLTLILGEMTTIQGNLLNAVAERTAGRGPSKLLRRQVTLARQWRLLDAKKALRMIGEGGAKDRRLSAKDLELSTRTRQRLTRLAAAFRTHEQTFDRLFAHGAVSGSEFEQLRESLLRHERKQLKMLRRLQRELRARVRSAAEQVAADQRTSLWAGLGLIVIALILSVLVAARVRRWLAPLKVLVGGTQRIASGDYSERVEVGSADELGQLAGEFNKMAEAVEEREQRLIRSERLAAAGRLAAHITHEVRNPLNSISLNTELLEEELLELPEDARDEASSILRAVQREVDRLTGITEEYLQFARLPKPNLAAEDANEILASLLGFLTGELEQQKVELRRELSDALPLIAVDENQLRQALLNLLRNAKEAMPGGGELTVGSRSVHRGAGGARQRWVELRIADTGMGIPPEVLEQVFEPFFSTKDGGTGLGLALTQQIVHEHGGDLEVQSEADVGTTFVLTLPVSGAQDRVDQTPDDPT